MKRQIATTLAALAGLGALGVVACGPSFQVVYEGDARFEHCYALDETPQISMQEKSDCWSTWIRSYTNGQTRNRVDYAAMRAKAAISRSPAAALACGAMAASSTNSCG